MRGEGEGRKVARWGKGKKRGRRVERKGGRREGSIAKKEKWVAGLWHGPHGQRQLRIPGDGIVLEFQ